MKKIKYLIVFCLISFNSYSVDFELELDLINIFINIGSEVSLPIDDSVELAIRLDDKHRFSILGSFLYKENVNSHEEGLELEFMYSYLFQVSDGHIFLQA